MSNSKREFEKNKNLNLENLYNNVEENEKKFFQQSIEKINILDNPYKEYEKESFRFEDEKTLMDRAKKLPFIKSQNVEWESMKKDEDGSILMPYPKYSDEVYNFIEKFYELKLIDYNYLPNYEKYLKYKEKEIDDLSFKEILSYITYIIREERFCEGLIASNLENGKIEELEKSLFSRYIKFDEIDCNNIDKIKENEIMFLLFEEIDINKEICDIKIITKNNNNIKLYYINSKDSVNIKKLYSKFSIIETLNKNIENDLGKFTHIPIGKGKHLLVNSIVNESFKIKIENKEKLKIYANWLKYALDILKYDWQGINKK